MLGELLTLKTSDEVGADDIDRATSEAYFNEKNGLLNEFQAKIVALERSL
jgi:hypothetical protein